MNLIFLSIEKDGLHYKKNPKGNSLLKSDSDSRSFKKNRKPNHKERLPNALINKEETQFQLS